MGKKIENESPAPCFALMLEAAIYANSREVGHGIAGCMLEFIAVFYIRSLGVLVSTAQTVLPRTSDQPGDICWKPGRRHRPPITDIAAYGSNLRRSALQETKRKEPRNAHPGGSWPVSHPHRRDWQPVAVHLLQADCRPVSLLPLSAQKLT